MKVLKSGIEMKPDELDKLRGGVVCACGCGIGFSGEQLNSSGTGGCFCGCTSPRSPFTGNSKGAHNNFNPIV